MSHSSHRKGYPGRTRLLSAVVLNFAITIAEVIGGLASGSLALLSDALHNFSDGIALIISYIAILLSGRESTLKKTFGFRRAEILAALFNASILVIVIFFLFREAWRRLMNPTGINAGLMIIVASIGLAANLAAVLILRRDAKQSINVRSAYLHLLADTISSVGVIVGGLLIALTGISWIDPLLTVLIGCYVLKETYGILRETANILMQATPERIDIIKLKTAIEALPEVNNVHHVHVWQMNDRQVNFEGHIDVCADLKLSEVAAIQRRVEQLLEAEFDIQHVTLQVEYGVCTDKNVVGECGGNPKGL